MLVAAKRAFSTFLFSFISRGGTKTKTATSCGNVFVTLILRASVHTVLNGALALLFFSVDFDRKLVIVVGGDSCSDVV